MVLGLLVSADEVVRVAAFPSELVLFVAWHVNVLEVPLRMFVPAGLRLGRDHSNHRQETGHRELRMAQNRTGQIGGQREQNGSE